MKIGNIDLDHEVLVVAEIGNNHEGSYTLAEELIGLAAEAGVGAVKFQTIIPAELVSSDQTERIKQLERFSLGYEQFERLAEVARREGVLFLSTPFDLESARFLEPLVPAYKIASADNTFFPLIEEVAKTGKPVLLSAGLANLDEITYARDFIFEIWNERGIFQELAILHCVTSYPTPNTDANLLAIVKLGKLGVTVGYSDHTLAIEAAVISVALGARIIEKHFTLDKNYSDFRDHKLSADPAELALLVRRVKITEKLLGTGEKAITASEMQIKSQLRRSIAARVNLLQGKRLKWEHLCWVRPGQGIPPGNEEEVLGKVLRRSVTRGELILPEDVALEGG